MSTQSESADQVFAVGTNLVGYLPEGDIHHTSDFADAREVLLDELRRDADHAAETEQDELAGQLHEEIKEAQAWTGPNSTIVGNVAYWVTTVDPEEADPFYADIS